jgi:hypothetical protein
VIFAVLVESSEHRVGGCSEGQGFAYLGWIWIGVGTRERGPRPHRRTAGGQPTRRVGIRSWDVATTPLKGPLGPAPPLKGPLGPAAPPSGIRSGRDRACGARSRRG